ncbi:hypothetical protein [Jannaschia formosa]|uniref:hypothetical protein n=1 Tax=Jannaschia formosa TaxID=2259592 RepID=UPI001074F37F|nr:hypothetical protein [Jannaschia formosa]TFL17924.1 hypothetical protein DR046_12225 [Jannaschia formosa]
MSISPPGFTIPAAVALEAAEDARRILAAQVAGLAEGADCLLDFDGDTPGVLSIQLAASARRTLLDAGRAVSFGPVAAQVFTGARDGDAPA